MNSANESIYFDRDPNHVLNLLLTAIKHKENFYLPKFIVEHQSEAAKAAIILEQKNKLITAVQGLCLMAQSRLPTTEQVRAEQMIINVGLSAYLSVSTSGGYSKWQQLQLDLSATNALSLLQCTLLKLGMDLLNGKLSLSEYLLNELKALRPYPKDYVDFLSNRPMRSHSYSRLLEEELPNHRIVFECAFIRARSYLSAIPSQSNPPIEIDLTAVPLDDRMSYLELARYEQEFRRDHKRKLLLVISSLEDVINTHYTNNTKNFNFADCSLLAHKIETLCCSISNNTFVEQDLSDFKLFISDKYKQESSFLLLCDLFIKTFFAVAIGMHMSVALGGTLVTSTLIGGLCVAVSAAVGLHKYSVWHKHALPINDSAHALNRDVERLIENTKALNFTCSS